MASRALRCCCFCIIVFLAAIYASSENDARILALEEQAHEYQAKVHKLLAKAQDLREHRVREQQGDASNRVAFLQQAAGAPGDGKLRRKLRKCYLSKTAECLAQEESRDGRV